MLPPSEMSMPYFFKAVATTLAPADKPEISNDDFNRNRAPYIGAGSAPVQAVVECDAGCT